jgi:hypothetical protein
MLIKCPHCNEIRFIEQINCGIFRDGIFKHNLEQIPPHSSKDDCDKFIRENSIIGCGKPFRIYEEVNSKKFIIEKCDYI